MGRGTKPFTGQKKSINPEVKPGQAGAASVTVPGAQPTVKSVSATVKCACSVCGGGGCSNCDGGWVSISWEEHARRNRGENP